MLSLVSTIFLLSSSASATLLHQHYREAPVRRDTVYATTAYPEAVAPPAPTGGSSGSSCDTPFWMELVEHQGRASFNNDTSYQAFRNVKDYGAVGDGVTDDTKAIQKAISDGGGVRRLFIIGNPNCLPILKATANFTTVEVDGEDIGYLIDGSPYGANGLGFGPTNTFFRQVRNLILDSTNVKAGTTMRGMHWPTAQTTSVQNVVFRMTAGNGTKHEGLFIESGSGGFVNDLVFSGGRLGLNVGNQQFTMRNLTFDNVDTAIYHLWDWGWTYKSVSINNCRVGVNMSAPNPDSGGLNVGSITLIDSSIKNTPIGIVTARTEKSQPDSTGSLYMENVKLENVQLAIVGVNGTILTGSPATTHIDAWADGHRYLPVFPLSSKVQTPLPPLKSRGSVAPSKRPSSLVDASGKFYERSKPQYENLPLDQFLSARTLGVKGDGVTDDTEALNKAIQLAKEENKVLFVDAGYYKVSSTVYIPAGSKIVGEALSSVIMSSGPFFEDMASPKPVVQVGRQGEQGAIEWSDFFVSTQGAQAGAVLIEYNLYSTKELAGLWDVHARIGGFAGSQLQNEQCPKTPGTTVTADNLNKDCIAAYMSLHITPWASGVYFENNWLWVADHDLDDTLNNNTQITLYAGRGLLDQSLQGRVWLYGTAVEHHVLYEYQFVDTKDVFMGQIQTETAYYQPNPDATIPFPAVSAIFDPVFVTGPSSNSSVSNTTHPISPNNAEGWGLRILRSNNLLVYGAGLYSFFDNYSTKCSDVASQGICQSRILSIEGDALSHDINVYNLNTVGATWMVTRDGVDLVANADNNGSFVDGINMYRS